MPPARSQKTRASTRKGTCRQREAFVKLEATVGSNS